LEGERSVGEDSNRAELGEEGEIGEGFEVAKLHGRRRRKGRNEGNEVLSSIQLSLLSSSNVTPLLFSLPFPSIGCWSRCKKIKITTKTHKEQIERAKTRDENERERERKRERES